MNGARLADVAAASSFIGWLASLAVKALPIIQCLAGVIAIAAGIAAYRYHTAARRNLTVRDHGRDD